MSILISSIILLSMASAYAVLLKRKLAETFFLAIVTVVAVLYCFGLINVAGCLLYGIYFIIALTVACVVFLVYTFLKTQKSVYEAEILQGCLIYVGILAVALFINFGRTPQEWDEISHWGPFVKHFYENNALGTFVTPDYNLIYPAYYPGMNLFHYFFMRFSSRFVDYYMYIAVDVMYFSLIMPFIKDILNKAKWIGQVVLLGVFFILPLLSPSYHFFYGTLYVDAMLGVFFGIALVYYVNYKYEESPYGMLMVSAAIFMISAIKDTGLLFSAGITAVIFIDTILFRRSEIKAYMALKQGLRYKLKALILLLSPLICFLFVRLSWSNLLDRANLKSVFYVPTLNDIYMLLTKQVEEYQKQSARHFIYDLPWRKLVNFNVSIIYFAVIFIVVVFILSLINKKKVNWVRMTIMGLLLDAGLVAYHVVLMIIHVFSSSEYDALHATSYERYMSTYLIGMVFFIMLFYLPEQNVFSNINFSRINELSESDEIVKITYRLLFRFGQICLYSLLSICLLLNTFNNTKGMIANTVLGRLKQPVAFSPWPTTVAIEKWKPYFSDVNPYVIVQEDNGYWYNRIKYDQLPANVMWDYSISPEPYHKDYDPWTFIVSPEEWEAHFLASEYKLLYVYQSNEQLETVYGRFFPYGVQSDMLYYVQNDNGSLSLVPVVDMEEE